jgi:hypothetical protein
MLKNIEIGPIYASADNLSKYTRYDGQANMEKEKNK